jgi:hypothetical protein
MPFVDRRFIQSHCHNILWVFAPVLPELAHSSTQVVCYSADAILQRDITQITRTVTTLTKRRKSGSGLHSKVYVVVDENSRSTSNRS